MAHQDHRLGSMIQAMLDGGNGRLNPENHRAQECDLILLRTQLYLIHKVNGLFIDFNCESREEASEVRWTLPLVVCDVMVLHWNIEVNSEREERN